MISLIKDTIFYSSSKVLAGLLNLLIIMMFTRFLNQEDYGYYLIFISYTFFISSLFYWAQRISVNRYLNDYMGNYNSFIKTNIALFFKITIVIICLNILIFLSFVDLKFKILIYLCSLAAFLKSFFDLNQAILNMNFKSFLFSFNIILRSLFFISISFLLFYFFNLKSESLIFGFLVSYFLVLCTSSLSIFKKYFNYSYDKKIEKKIISFSVPLVGLFFCDYILTFSDRIFIHYYLGTENVGIYGANYDLIKQLSLFFMIVQGYIMYPRINKAYSNKDRIEFNTLFNYNIKLFLITFIPLCFFIIYFNNFISNIFLGEAFRYADFPIIPLFSIMFFMWGIKIHHFDYIFQLKEKTKFSFYILFLGSIINIVLNIFLIPIFGLMGALYSTFLAYLFILVFSIILGRQFIEINFPYLVFLKVIFNLFICFIILEQISHLVNPIMSIIILFFLYLLNLFLFNKKDLLIKL